MEEPFDAKWIRKQRMRSKYRKSRKRKRNEKPSAAEAISKSSQPPWIELPKDVTANILQRLGVEDLLDSAQYVCRTWRELCKDPSMWRVIDMKCLDEEDEELCDHMCRCAVDLSQGQLIDLRISYFGDDELLSFVADRSSHLQCLTLSYCPYLDSLVESVEKLLQLQELHLTISPSVNPDDIEAIGLACPMLKSFTYNTRWSDYSFSLDLDEEPTDSNEYCFAIAKTMPNLRHLRLFAHWMRNEGLEAILDGCPHLESLDIRECSSLDLKGALGKRCYKQIKTLRGPSDSTTDFEWPSLGYGCRSPYTFSESSIGSFGDPRLDPIRDDEDDARSLGCFGDPGFDPYGYDHEFDPQFDPFDRDYEFDHGKEHRRARSKYEHHNDAVERERSQITFRKETRKFKYYNQNSTLGKVIIT